MNHNDHERAKELIFQRDVEGISQVEGRWLESHLAACQDCASFALAMGDAERALRSFPVMASSLLVEATKARVHARAEQLRELESRRYLIAISFAMGVVFSTLSAWMWWEAGGWMVEHFGLPSALVTPGLVVFWLLPAVFLGVMLLAFPESGFEGSVMHLFMKDRQGGVQ
jgi:predicted anti-sigma-YlaC factor YlaD